ncbi:cell division protein FtsA [Desulfallas thermosapovorans]|uniref:Cell division protein FtsA n=1 Tax=Desulfallas thermosapovorans DSM 6562 TaxID=1121431 RepID=A0A5S4ZSR7_9FIRM|nr:cell division protein FtsA [Desulfallas thermosapovorans]TYO95897.1 cell division protein FtsA [Desulfallas thermosapovorans DSM 6562]
MAGTAQKDVVVGLDIGTSGIAVAVLKCGCGAKQEPLGFGYCPSIGVKNGQAVDIHDAAAAIKKAVSDARAAAGVPFDSVNIGIDGPELVVRHGREKQVMARRRAVDRQDLQNLQHKFSQAVLPADWAIVQLVNADFRIDGKHTARPLGCRGRELEMEATALAVPGSNLETTMLCLHNAGLQAVQSKVGSLATARAVLAAVEGQVGVVCVDMGAGMTRAIFINHGTLRYISVFPVGAGHITADLAVGLHTTLETAEKIKITYGLGSIDEEVRVPNISGTGCNVVSGKLVHRIIRSRIEEILEFVKQFLEHLELGASLPGGIVITGGGARLRGLLKMARDYWEMPVRRGCNTLLVESVPEEEAYRYNTAVGLALREPGQGQVPCGVKRMTEGGLVGRIKSWLR